MKCFINVPGALNRPRPSIASYPSVCPTDWLMVLWPRRVCLGRSTGTGAVAANETEVYRVGVRLLSLPPFDICCCNCFVVVNVEIDCNCHRPLPMEITRRSEYEYKHESECDYRPARYMLYEGSTEFVLSLN